MQMETPNSGSDTESSSEDEFIIRNLTKSSYLTEITVKKEYVHEIFKHLYQDYSVIAEKVVNVVFFNINNDNITPFIRFLLVKQEDTLSFYKTKLSLEIKKVVANLLLKDESAIRLKGYTAYNKNIYLFVDILDQQKPSLCKRNTQSWYCLVDEIINHRKICNFPIHPSVTEYLLSKPDYFLLKHPETKHNYEIPIVVYSGSRFHQVELDGIFGPQKKSETSLFGQHYYLTNYEKAVEMGGWSSNKSEEYKFGNLITDTRYGRYIKGGINRYALFCSKQMVIKEPKPHYRMPYNYDTLYIGIMQLNENIYNDSPIWITKKSTQFISLSYHELDKNTLGDEWNKDCVNYFIS